MVAQLSTSGPVIQPKAATLRRRAWLASLLLLCFGTAALGQGSEIERRIDPLSAIDIQFMDNQRADIERRANAIGRTLTGAPPRDLDTLQRLIDARGIATDDALTLQAMGVVFGDLLASELDMDWVVYLDRAGRSRALRYRDDDTFLFPVTMIERRYSAGAPVDLTELFNRLVDDTTRRLPGGRWR